MMARMSAINRRAALGLGLRAGLAALGACTAGSALASTPAAAVPPAPLAPPHPTYESGSFTSVARGGVVTNWIVARPPGQTEPLRPVILLHGKDSNAQTVMSMGAERFLADAVAAGVAPFALAAVDGGNGYWHRRASGDDSGAMVLDEFLPLLADHGLDTSRVAFLGWSMGGYGAMLLGSRLGAARGNLRGEPGAVDECRCRRPGGVRRTRRLCRQQRVGAGATRRHSVADRLR